MAKLIEGNIVKTKLELDCDRGIERHSSVPSLDENKVLAAPLSARSRVHAKAGQKGVDLFDDLGSSERQEASEVTDKPLRSRMNMQCGDVVEGETLYSDY